MYLMQWHLENKEQYPESVIDMDLDMLLAYQLNITGEGIHIAVLANYIDYTHDDLVWRFSEATSKEYYEPKKSEDFTYHGTAMATLALGESNTVMHDGRDVYCEVCQLTAEIPHFFFRGSWCEVLRIIHDL